MGWGVGGTGAREGHASWEEIGHTEVSQGPVLVPALPVSVGPHGDTPFYLPMNRSQAKVLLHPARTFCNS